MREKSAIHAGLCNEAAREHIRRRNATSDASHRFIDRGSFRRTMRRMIKKHIARHRARAKFLRPSTMGKRAAMIARIARFACARIFQSMCANRR